MYRGIGYPLLPRFWTAVRPFVRSSRIGKNNRFYGRLAIIERDHGGMGQHFTWDFLGLRAFISHLNSFLLANTRLRLRNPLYYLCRKPEQHYQGRHSILNFSMKKYLIVTFWRQSLQNHYRFVGGPQVIRPWFLIWQILARRNYTQKFSDCLKFFHKKPELESSSQT